MRPPGWSIARRTAKREFDQHQVSCGQGPRVAPVGIHASLARAGGEYGLKPITVERIPVGFFLFPFLFHSPVTFRSIFFYNKNIILTLVKVNGCELSWGEFFLGFRRMVQQVEFAIHEYWLDALGIQRKSAAKWEIERIQRNYPILPKIQANSPEFSLTTSGHWPSAKSHFPQIDPHVLWIRRCASGSERGAIERLRLVLDKPLHTVKAQRKSFDMFELYQLSTIASLMIWPANRNSLLREFTTH